MTKTLLIVNKHLNGTPAAWRGYAWQLQINPRRGHPMVSRRDPPHAGPTDYFRACMARYYSFKTAWSIAGFVHYDNFGFINNDTDPDEGQTTAYYVAFRISNYPNFEANTALEFNSAAMVQHSSFTRWGLQSPSAAVRAAYIFGMTTANIPTPCGTETQRLNVVARVDSWLTVSETKNIKNFAEHLDSPASNGELSWLNWQAYVMGDAALDFDGAARKFPGIFGPGMINNIFYDHAFERDIPDEIPVQANYNYYNSFFDTLKSNPYVLETHIPNFYLVNSIRYNKDGPVYTNLFYDYTMPDHDYMDLSSLGIIKTILSDVVGPITHIGATDVLNEGDVTLDQIAASLQEPNSVLSRFTRMDFSDNANTGSLGRVNTINRHIGLPHRMLAGGANSTVKDMNEYEYLFPYSLKVPLPYFDGSTIIGDVYDDIDKGALSDFFLYEIMKANINDFSNQITPFVASSANSEGPSTSTAGAYPPEDQVYGNLELSAVLTDSEAGIQTKYYGFEGTIPGAWASNPQALEPYSLRTIDIPNLFKNMYGYQFDFDSPVGKYGITPNSYNGFIGQTEFKNVAEESGIVVGENFALAGGHVNVEDLITTSNLTNGLIGVGTIGLNAFLIEFADILNARMRNYAALIKGEKAFRDTLVYKLDKHTVNSNGEPSETPIQSIYLANVEGAHTYVDTQVFFGKKYMYKLYAYDLVVGNQYKYVNEEVFPPIELPYPHAFVNQLEGGIFEGDPENRVSPDWSLSDAPYLSAGIYHKTFASTAPLLFWTNGQIMPGIDLSDGIQLGELFGLFAYPAYVDIKINNFKISAPLSHLSHILLPGAWAAEAEAYTQNIEDIINGMVDEYFSRNPQFTHHVKQLSKVRVRLLLNASGNAQIFIAQVGMLQRGDLGSAAQTNILSMLLETSPALNGTVFIHPNGPFHPHIGGMHMSEFEDYFDLSILYRNALNSGGERYFADLSILFETGQYGTAPTIPWNQHRAGSAKVTVKNYKSPKIFEIPLGETKIVQVSDLPPQFPDVDIFPLYGSNRDIKILLSSNFTKAAYIPILIESTDEQIFNEVRLNQGKDVGDPIIFGSDDSRTSYQIFRTTIQPTSYQDFGGKLHLTKEAITSGGTRVESMSLLDRIKPNVYYYYCFRTIDKNGYISNPSPVLRVQMVDDNGRIYPIIEAYNFNLNNPKKTERSFKRYLEIDTSLQERMVIGTDPDTAGSPNTAPTNVMMGTSAGVFASNTTYKVRIISKDTGRKIDLNLNFNVETIPNPKIPGN